MKAKIFLICLTAAIYGCKTLHTLKSPNCSYDLIINYGEIDQIRKPFILYQNKLFEFIVNNSESNNLVISKKNVIGSNKNTLDTIGIQIIDIKHNNFTFINNFSDYFVVKSVGKYDTSRIGFKPSLSKKESVIKEFVLRDTQVNKIKLKYQSSITKNSIGHDSLIVKTFCIQKKGFVSVFTPNFDFSDLQFCGISITLVKENYTFSILPDNLRILSSKEQRICQQIISKMNLVTK